MAKTFHMSYRLYGTISIEAESEEEARRSFNPSDEELIENISRSFGNNIDADAIELYEVQEGDE